MVEVTAAMKSLEETLAYLKASKSYSEDPNAPVKKVLGKRAKAAAAAPKVANKTQKKDDLSIPNSKATKTGSMPLMLA